nr:matrixin family metalloprotease [Bacteroidota bacterium]
SIRYGISTEFPLTLEVTSIDERTFRQEINLNLFNEIPTIASNQIFSVRKDRVINSAIGQIDASDSDGNIEAFEIIEGNINNHFAVDTNGTITLAQVFNLNDSTGSNRLKIRIIDHGNDVGEEYININVNESFILPEQIFAFSQSNGNDVGRIEFSEDTEQIQSLTIVNGNNGNIFSIDNVGDINLLASINYGSNKQYSPLTLEVTTADQRRFRQTITIHLSNEVPMIALGQSFSMRKDRLASSIIGLVQASDTDGNIDSFEIIGGNASNHFSIDGNGDITLANAFTPADEIGTRALRIRVVDNGEGVGEETVNINVNESFITDNQSFGIRSNEEPIVVGTVRFSENVGQIQSLNILNGNIGNVFSIDGSGNIRIVGEIDYRLGQYDLTLEVVTIDQRTFRQDILIRLLYPIFSALSWDFTVKEFSKDNANVGQVTVRNASPNLIFFIPPHAGISIPFTIDNAGQIKVNGLIDFNRNSSYTFNITAREPNGVSDTATVNISVQKIGSDTVQMGAWDKSSLPINFLMGPGFSTAESNSLVNGLVGSGNSWNNLVRQNLFVIGGSTPQEAYNNVGNDSIFGIYKINSGWPADRASALGVARLSIIGGTIRNADVLFNFQHQTLLAGGVGQIWEYLYAVNFDLVIAHEFGHVLGLAHEPEAFLATESIMHPSLSPISITALQQIQITSRDTENIQKLYQFGITQPSALASVSALRQYDPDDITIIIIEFYADGSCVHYVDGKKVHTH